MIMVKKESNALCDVCGKELKEDRNKLRGGTVMIGYICPDPECSNNYNYVKGEHDRLKVWQERK